MKISAVLCTKGREEKALKCLASLANQAQKPYEIIIIDSSDTDSLKKNAEKILGKIKLVYIYKKCSMTAARNIGIRGSSGNIVLFVDDDVVLEKNYIKNLANFYENNPEAGGAEGLITNDRDRKIIDRLLNFPHFPGRNEIMKVRILHGSNMSFRKGVFREYLFNENLRGYYADDDEFCSRVSRRYVLFSVPSARCVHEHTPTGGARIDNYMNFNTLTFNQYYIFRNSKKSLLNVLMYIFSNIILIARIFAFVKKEKHRAIKGILRGYKRVVKSFFIDDIEIELQKL